MNELLDETKKYVTTGEMPSNKIFAHPLPLNVIPHIDVFQVHVISSRGAAPCLLGYSFVPRSSFQLKEHMMHFGYLRTSVHVG